MHSVQGIECLSQKLLQKLLRNDMDQAGRVSAGRRKSSLGLDKKSRGCRATLGFLCLFPVLALLAVLEYPTGTALQEIQVRKKELGGEGVSERGAGGFWLEEKSKYLNV